MKPLKIPCLYHTDLSDEKKELGLKLYIEDLQERAVHFFTIDAIGSGKWKSERGEEVPVSLIYSNSDCFESLLSVGEVLRRIEIWHEQRNT